VSDPSFLAEQWAQWAVSEAEAGSDTAITEAAEAYWRLVRQLPVELARRHTPAEQSRLSAAAQGTAAVAGYWLARAGQLDKAVLAVELGRAILLTRAEVGISPGVVQRLAAAGEKDLLARYDKAWERFETLQREGYLCGGAVAPVTGGMLSPLQRAWSELQECRYDIAAVIGDATVSAAPDLDDVRTAAGPDTLAYLAAADPEGYALVVGDEGPPTVLPLPHLTPQALEHRAHQYLDLLADRGLFHDLNSWRELLDWLGTAVMRPLLRETAPRRAETGCELVVVPVGALGLLPLHAAITGFHPDGTLAHALDETSLRYAPNARLLARARRSAEAWDGGGPVLAVQVTPRLEPEPPPDLPDVPRLPHLPHVAVEVRGVRALYGTRCRELRNPGVADMLAGLETAAVWHLACHGAANEQDPLASCLVLADGPLRLSDVLGRMRRHHRLAVLSACETAVPDRSRLDEAIGFPATLMSVGVDGVVATQWLADDSAAMFLMLRFHRGVVAGLAPGPALAQAQRWLRDADHRALLEELSADDAVWFAKEQGVSPHTRERWLAQRPFTHPGFWAGYTYTGV
jgi:CHAT domain-containing protein